MLRWVAEPAPREPPLPWARSLMTQLFGGLWPQEAQAVTFPFRAVRSLPSLGRQSGKVRGGHAQQGELSWCGYSFCSFLKTEEPLVELL